MRRGNKFDALCDFFDSGVIYVNVLFPYPTLDLLCLSYLCTSGFSTLAFLYIILK
jgi:hypothetical protein